MACAAAGLGLLPAALSSGIGVQAQQPSSCGRGRHDHFAARDLVCDPSSRQLLAPLAFTRLRESSGRCGCRRSSNIMQLPLEQVRRLFAGLLE